MNKHLELISKNKRSFFSNENTIYHFQRKSETLLIHMASGKPLFWRLWARFWKNSCMARS